jgi:hypothetical protein
MVTKEQKEAWLDALCKIKNEIGNVTNIHMHSPIEETYYHLDQAIGMLREVKAPRTFARRSRV